MRGIIVPRPVVQLEIANLHVCPAAELWLPHTRDELTGLPKKLSDLFEGWLLMAGSKANYLEDKIKNLILGAVAYTIPSPVFFGLWGTAASIGEAFNGGTAGEVTGGSYDRVSMTNNTTNFPTVTATDKLNNVAITFPTATANWNAAANINQVGTLDANAKTSGDNGMFWGDLTVPKPVLNGDQAQFAIGAWVWSED
jgi:hypothetical protein